MDLLLCRVCVCPFFSRTQNLTKDGGGLALLYTKRDLLFHATLNDIDVWYYLRVCSTPTRTHQQHQRSSRLVVVFFVRFARERPRRLRERERERFDI